MGIKFQTRRFWQCERSKYSSVADIVVFLFEVLDCLKVVSSFRSRVFSPRVMKNFGLRASCTLSFHLALWLVCFHPVLGENSTTTNSTNNTLFSRKNNGSRLETVSCEWDDVRPTYSIIAAIISGFLIVDGGVLCALGEFHRHFGNSGSDFIYIVSL